MTTNDFREAVLAARRPVSLERGGVSRLAYVVSGIPGAQRLPRALVTLLENVVRRAATDDDAVRMAQTIVSAMRSLSCPAQTSTIASRTEVLPKRSTQSLATHSSPGRLGLTKSQRMPATGSPTPCLKSSINGICTTSRKKSSTTPLKIVKYCG